MTKAIINLLCAAGCLIIILVPGAGLAANRDVASRAATTIADFPSLNGLVREHTTVTEQLSAAVRDRLPARYGAIGIRNEVSLRLFGAVETGEVVSGARGWLFYKPQFKNWTCDQHVDLRNQLERAAMVLMVAEEAGANVTFAIAPNKATVYPEMLSGRASRYADCYNSFSVEFRNALSRFPPNLLVDHLQSVAALKPQQVYFLEDTHWTPYAGYNALQQLFKVLPPSVHVVSQAPNSTKLYVRATDLGQRMLHLRQGETATRAQIEAVTDPRVGKGLLVIHDSFYAVLDDELDKVLPAATRVRLNHQRMPDEAELSKYEHIVVQSVERAFLARISAQPEGGGAVGFGWESAIGEHILGKADLAAENCFWPIDNASAEGVPAKILPGYAYQAALVASNVETSDYTTFSVPAAATGSVCLKLSFSGAGRTRLALLIADPETGEFRDARSVVWSLEGDETHVQLKLPQPLASGPFRVEVKPTDGFVFAGAQFATSGKR